MILLGRPREALSALDLTACVSEQDWRDYHVVAMAYLQTRNFDEALRRLRHGLNNTPFLTQKEYFANALAYAKLKNREYGQVEAIFEHLPETHNQVEAQKRRLFVVHSKAATQKMSEAREELAQIVSIGRRIDKLKKNLDERYCLTGQFSCAPADDHTRLDQAIEEEEFFLAMTLKAA